MRILLFLLAATSAMAADELPSGGAGGAIVGAQCTVCHSAKMLLQAKQDRAGWDRTIAKMQKQNGMWPLDEVTRNLMLDYLAANFSPTVHDSIDGGLGPRPVNPLPQ